MGFQRIIIILLLFFISFGFVDATSTAMSTEDDLFFGESNGFFILSAGEGEGDCGAIFLDDFENYNLGDLNGQGGWVDASGDFQVQSDVVFEGVKAGGIRPVAYRDVYKAGSALVSPGRIVVYLRQTVTNQPWRMALLEGTSHKVFAGLMGNVSNGKVMYFNGSAYVAFGDFSADTWGVLEAEWRNSGATSEVRYRWDEGTWTDWVSPAENWTIGLDRVMFTSGPSGDYTQYFDYIHCELSGEEEEVDLYEFSLLMFFAFLIFLGAASLMVHKK